MARWLCVHLPFFRTERISRASPRPPEALAVVREVGQTALVVAANPLAMAAGVASGMTLTAARAHLPSLAVSNINSEAETWELHSLAACALALSPRIFLHAPQTLLIDATGCERVHGGEPSLLKLTRELFMRLGYTANAALCGNPTTAIALALDGGRATPILGEDTVSALHDVPLASLRLDPRSLEHLGSLGISRAGELLALPPATLPSRFDEALVCRVRQLRGDLPEDFPAFSLPETVSERLDFEGPTDRRDAMMFALRHIATRLAERLDALGTGASRIQARLIPADGASLEFAVDVSAPTRDARSLATLLLARFETLDTHDRWFDGLEVCIPARQPVNSRQKDLFSAARDVFSPGLRGLVDELVGRLGVSAVARAVITPDPRPECAVAFAPFLQETKSAAAPNTAPAVLWPPQAIDVEEHEGAPRTWHEGRRAHSLSVVRGPQRVEFGWWDGQAEEPRDYFEVESAEGARLFFFRQAGRWFSCGAW
jgi:protein ImuB